MDRLTEMESFATVVDQGGFTDAARKLGMSKSAVSKHVSQLETRLGARLLNRTTRRVSPTDIGLAYYDRARRVLCDAGEADALVSSMKAAPTGQLTISAPTDFGSLHLSPLIAKFLTQFSEIRIRMVLNHAHSDLIGDGHDLAIRIGKLDDSSLRARKLAETALGLVASPGYLSTHGTPVRIDDLNTHNLLHCTDGYSACAWRLTAPSGEERQVRTPGSLTANDGRSLLQATISGLGIACLPSYLYADALGRGVVVRVMPDLPVAPLGIYAVFPPGRFTQPKLRAMIDFLRKELTGRGPHDW